ncbi:TolC family outer membrane protein [Methylobrevis pamukkalensis]|uniref:Outer membrane efflux protein BepC n=1 Tax=Methylobrevis pamukkalensis TaxID=1439726 RepID=A0A1E3H3E9_9HYPH|nr:TolC family outer membrane protein [Methylobrevis pamukkalensis]ODN70848.1 Outer membrane efflux protein BepC precursor [Methylobrevis pamukkalensis]
MLRRRNSILSRALAAVVVVVSMSPVALSAETLTEALALAYANNPTLNAARAGTRATDEDVPQALAGYRPTVSAFATGTFDSNFGDHSRIARTGLTLTQPIFRGFRTENSVNAAEASVRASRESLRNTEQNVLLDGVEAYMNLIRDRAIVDLRKANLAFLNEQVRAANDRFSVGEGTRTDVAQANAALAAASSSLALAEANVMTDEGAYKQVFGRAPSKLTPGKPIDGMLPKSFERAVTLSRKDHPAILSAVHSADVAAYNVKIVEGELLPSVSLEANIDRTWAGGNTSTDTGNNASIVGQITIPLYEGGAVHSGVRQAKETLGQARIQVDVTRDQVQAALISAWGALEAAKAQTVAARSQIEASQLALDGVLEEQRVGQRTTLDVLNAQTDLVNAQVTQVQAARDVIVAGYTVLATIGRLSSTELKLKIATYRPEVHYKQVRDKWGGLRTPDGR